VTETTPWLTVFNQLLLSAEEDEDWDDHHAKVKARWQEEYAQAFVEIAVSRGWSRENARTWPHELDEDAFVESYKVDYDPRRAAEIDVMACEDPLP
jgi:hypothetical protein